MRRQVLLLLFSLFAIVGFAQQRTVTGTVVSAEDGLPVIGASIHVKGSSQGATTDLDGKYSIKVNENASLTFSYVGMQPKTVQVGNQSVINVTLTSSSTQLDEVVVTAMGIREEKKKLNFAVQSLNADEVTAGQSANFVNSLQGKIAGVQVSGSGGSPNSSSQIIIRAISSINSGQNNEPLFIIDGMPMRGGGSSAGDINPNDIESITVLKDASSAAIYGARGAFGVILITTKSGRYNEKAEVSYNGYFSMSSPTTSTDYETRGYYSAKIADFFMMATQNTPYTSYTEADYKALWERRNDKTENPARPWVITDRRNGRQQYVYLANFDWYNYLYDDSRPTWDHNINIKGGTKALSYMVSGRYYQQKGVNRLEPDMFRSYNFRVKLQAEIKPWLTIASNTKFFQSNYKYYGYEDEYNNFRKPTLHALASFVPVNPDGTAVSHTSMTQSSTHYVMDGYNAMMQKGKSFGNKKTQEITTTFEATFKLHKNFNIKADFSYTQGYLHNDYRSVNVQYSQYPGEVMTEPEGSFPNKYKEVVWDQNYYVADVYGTYNRTFAEKHNLTLIAGYNYEAKYYRDLTAANDGLLSEDLSDFNLAKGTTNFTLNGGRNEYAIMGLFYRAAYDYRGKYLFEVNGRYDGSSKFPNNSQWGFFPSASAAWRVSQEKFWNVSPMAVSNLKVRASYGALGNSNVDPYTYLETFGLSTFGTGSGDAARYLFGQAKLRYTSLPGQIPDNIGWETSKTFDVGLDAGFLNGRLNLTADYYVRKTVDMYTVGPTLPDTFGATAPKGNYADMSTYGYEISLSYNDSFRLAGKPFNFGIKTTLADYYSVIDRYNNASRKLSDYYEGQRLGEIWGFVCNGLFQNQAEIDAAFGGKGYKNDIMQTSEKYITYPGDMRFEDLNGNDAIDRGSSTVDDPGDRKIIGNSEPRYIYTISLNADWNGFFLSALFDGVGRQQWFPSDESLFWGMYNRPYNQVPTWHLQNYWTEERPNAYLPRYVGYYGPMNAGTANINTRYLQDVSYIRLKNLQFGYDLPKRWISKIGLSKVSVYFSGENLWSWSPLYRHTKDFDVMVANKKSDSDISDSKGDGHNYPVMRSFSFGISITY